MSPKGKPLLWLHGEVKSPPLSPEGRIEAGYLLRLLQKGESIGMPASRPMPSIGPKCHELRINDSAGNWRLMYRVDTDAIVIVAVFAKKDEDHTQGGHRYLPKRLKKYDNASKQAPKPRR